VKSNKIVAVYFITTEAPAVQIFGRTGINENQKDPGIQRLCSESWCYLSKQRFRVYTIAWQYTMLVLLTTVFPALEKY